MRYLKASAAVLVFFILINGCKPKNKMVSLKDLVTTDSSKKNSVTDKPELSRRELIVRKWRITDILPSPTQEERDEIINSTMEFTKEGKLLLTSKGKTEEVATINFTFDDKYLLSRGDHNELDTMLIQELTVNRMVLVSTKDNKTMIAEGVR